MKNAEEFYKELKDVPQELTRTDPDFIWLAFNSPDYVREFFKLGRRENSLVLSDVTGEIHLDMQLAILKALVFAQKSWVKSMNFTYALETFDTPNDEGYVCLYEDSVSVLKKLPRVLSTDCFVLPAGNHFLSSWSCNLKSWVSGLIVVEPNVVLLSPRGGMKTGDFVTREIDYAEQTVKYSGTNSDFPEISYVSFRVEEN